MSNRGQLLLTPQFYACDERISQWFKSPVFSRNSDGPGLRRLTLEADLGGLGRRTMANLPEVFIYFSHQARHMRLVHHNGIVRSEDIHNLKFTGD